MRVHEKAHSCQRGTPVSEQGSVQLESVDALDVTVVVDNAIDILAANTEVAQRSPLAWDWSERDQLRAEHGYALWVTVERRGQRDTLLYDAGLGRDTAAHNLDVLGYDLKDVRALAFSHGHADHHTGLEGITRRLGRRGLPLVLHPDAWRDRRVVFPSGTEIHMPPPSQQDLDREGWQIVEERGPSLLLNGAVLVTGQVERVTDFEKGFPLQRRAQPRVAGSQIRGSGTTRPWSSTCAARGWWCCRVAATPASSTSSSTPGGSPGFSRCTRAWVGST